MLLSALLSAYTSESVVMKAAPTRPTEKVGSRLHEVFVEQSGRSIRTLSVELWRKF